MEVGNIHLLNLRCGGNQGKGFDQAGEVILPFYKQLLGKQTTTRSCIDRTVINAGSILSFEQQVAMCTDFSNKEIKETMFLIPNIKSGSPYGFNSGFYKSTWNIFRTLVCSSIKEFFLTGRMQKYLGAMKLVVIPKIQRPRQQPTSGR